MNTTMSTEQISQETTVSSSSTESGDESILVGEFPHPGLDPATAMAYMYIEILKLQNRQAKELRRVNKGSGQNPEEKLVQ